MPSQSKEDYLKNIYHIEETGGKANTGNLASMLSVSPASVSEMVAKLSKQGWIENIPYHGFKLTKEGEKISVNLVRKHRLLEVFLQQHLNYEWDEVHAEAERLEHFISERMEERIAAKLGDPLIDPHGHGIPRKDGSLPVRREVCLAELPAGDAGVVTSVSDRRPDVLRELKNLGIVPRTQLTVIERRAGSRPMRVRIGGAAQEVPLTARLSSAVYITL